MVTCMKDEVVFWGKADRTNKTDRTGAKTIGLIGR